MVTAIEPLTRRRLPCVCERVRARAENTQRLPSQ